MRAAADVGHVIKTDALATSDVDPTTLDLLLRLRFAPTRQLRGVDLCRQLHKSPSHLSRLLERAEAGGLVRRSPDPNDRRAHLIAATPQGDAAIDDYLPHLASILETIIFSTLSTAETETLIELLGKVSAAAAQLTTRKP